MGNSAASETVGDNAVHPDTVPGAESDLSEIRHVHASADFGADFSQNEALFRAQPKEGDPFVRTLPKSAIESGNLFGPEEIWMPRPGQERAVRPHIAAKVAKSARLKAAKYAAKNVRVPGSTVGDKIIL